MFFGALIFYLSKKLNLSPFSFSFSKSNSTAKGDNYKSGSVVINNHKFKVEIADTPQKLAKGLSDRASLGEDWGMLFVIEPPSIRTFWMKDMLIPLDLIWIKDLKIIYISKNAPIPLKNTPDYNLTLYTPGAPVDFVLEINAGLSDKYSFIPGNEVDINF